MKNGDFMLSLRSDLLKKTAEMINQYSPLIIQGESGIGKTFFTSELCNLLYKNGTIKKYQIRNSWDVTNEMICALCDNNFHTWRQEWLSSEIIIIEDFQFLQNKATALEELYQIFQSVNAPIIITTTLPITKENIACADLGAFLNQGTRITLNQPTKADIEVYLKHLLQDFKIYLTDKAFDWLMNQQIDSLSIAKGIVKTLHLYQEDTSKPIAVEDCVAIILPILSSPKESL